ncbi:ABC transporter permease [Pseudoglutamicibacter albus]|uniref:ABC transporter permease n=1 Tax=Pseudoglutamicibacter albus TaxID=98671 RepID=UPI00068B4E21
MTSQTTAKKPKATSHNWLGLGIQLLVLLGLIGAVFIYLAAAELSPTAASTLSPKSLAELTVQHIELTVVSTLIVLVIAIPLGVLLTRKPLRFLTGPVIAVANIGQAAPAIGLVVLLAMWMDFGFWSAVVALVVYAVLPVLRNTMVGLDGVDRRLIEAGRGMGMSSLSVLFRVELPLAVPVMLAGIRTALVLLVGTATLATFVDGGGLGLLITTGVNLSQTTVVVVGAVLVALLALVIDWVGRVVEHVARPKGL